MTAGISTSHTLFVNSDPSLGSHLPLIPLSTIRWARYLRIIEFVPIYTIQGLDAMLILLAMNITKQFLKNMKTNKFLGAIQLMALSSLLYSCNSAQSEVKSDLDEARKAIAASNDIYFQAFAKGDSSIFIERYADDCCIMPPGAPAMCGPEAALKFFRIAYYGIGLRNGKFITTQVYGAGENFVVEEGLWQSFDANNTMFDDGKFLVLWKKTPKGWKMFRDSFSSNRGN